MALEVTSVDFVHLKKGKGPIKAFATVTFNKVLIVKGFKVVEGDKGYFVGKPSQQGADDKWYDNVLVKGKEAWAAIQDAIIAEYEDSDKNAAPKKYGKKRDDDDDDRGDRRSSRSSRRERDDDDDEKPKKKSRRPSDDDDDDDIFGD